LCDEIVGAGAPAYIAVQVVQAPLKEVETLPFDTVNAVVYFPPKFQGKHMLREVVRIYIQITINNTGI
jgi:hypothetical protein